MLLNNGIFVGFAVVYIGFCGVQGLNTGWVGITDKLWPLVTLVAPSPTGGRK